MSAHPQIRVEDLPLWPEAPFRAKLAPRFQIRHGEVYGKRLAIVWDPKARCWGAGPERDWSDLELETVMSNLCGATFLQRFGRDAYTQVLEAKKVSPGALSAEARALLASYDEIYDWRAPSAEGIEPSVSRQLAG